MLTEQELNMIQAREKRFDYVEVGIFTGRVKSTAKGAMFGTNGEKRTWNTIKNTVKKNLPRRSQTVKKN